MSELIANTHHTLRYFACGGTAANLLQSHTKMLPIHEDAHAEELYTYVDTGTANLEGVESSQVFVVEGAGGKQGSGKDRGRNAKLIKEALPSIMQKHKPADINVVIFSSAGGSGSTSGPIILEELIKQGKIAIAIVIGVHTSGKATDNTIKTITGLEGIVARHSRPVVLAYRENDPTKNNAENNVVPLFYMSALSMFCSGKNKHLDITDIANMTDFHLVSHAKPSLAVLDIYADEAQLLKEANGTLAYGALLKSENDVPPQIATEYDTIGYMPGESSDRYNSSFFFTVGVARFKTTLTKLIEHRDNLETARRVQEKQVTLMNDNVSIDDDSGLVL